MCVTKNEQRQNKLERGHTKWELFKYSKALRSMLIVLRCIKQKCNILFCTSKAVYYFVITEPFTYNKIESGRHWWTTTKSGWHLSWRQSADWLAIGSVCY